MMTAKGIRQAFVLAFLNVQTRRVILSPATFQPNAEWIEAQAESYVEQARAEGLPVARLMRDRDGAFTQVFDDALRRKHVKVLQTQFRSPNMNAYVERFVQSIKQECLDHFVIFGARHSRPTANAVNGRGLRHPHLICTSPVNTSPSVYYRKPIYLLHRAVGQ
ncbi:MAG: hypothetical protein WDZ59_03835 [Pirellulales bacterium]